MTSVRIQATHLPGMYREAARRYGEMPAFATRESSDHWRPTSYRELWERGGALAAALMELGVKARDRVGLFADNRLEWILADYAIQICGAADVPRGQDVTTGELAYILDHAGIEVIILENGHLLERLAPAIADRAEKPVVILMDGKPCPEEKVTTLAELEKRGQAIEEAWREEREKRLADLSPDDLFTLIYTSGTTGTPKGVMLTHANMMSQIRHIPLDLTWRDRALSLLPIWHSFERVMEMIAISSGACIYYSSVRHLKDDMLAVEPTLMASAPRLWESLHDRILKQIAKSHPVRRGLFYTARWLSSHYHNSLDVLKDRDFLDHRPRRGSRAIRKISHFLRWFALLPWYGFFNAAVLERLRQVAGGSLRATVSGGGALPGEIDRFFNHLGIQVLEGYGLTETSPVLAVRRPEKRVIGTVGPLIPETELKIIDIENGRTLYPDPEDPGHGRMRKGEICVRGPQVMQGYYRNTEATSAVLKEGWLHTGDLGLVSWNDCLRVIGRSKETIVLASGENLEPGPIEMRLRQSPLIAQCMVVGQDERHPGCLIYPDEAACREQLGGANGTAPEAHALQKLIEKEVHQLISGDHGFKTFERIRRVRLLDRPFEMGSEITALHKLRRHVITENYQELIAAMFADSHHPHHDH